MSSDENKKPEVEQKPQAEEAGNNKDNVAAAPAADNAAPPAAAAGTAAASTAPNPKDFNVGLCECFSDFKGCCESLWFPWCYQGYLGNAVHDQGGMSHYYCWGGCPLDVIGGGLARMINSGSLRKEAKTKLGMDAGLGDFCVGFWCPLCSEVQISQEFTLRKMHYGTCCTAANAGEGKEPNAPQPQQMDNKTTEAAAATAAEPKKADETAAETKPSE